MKKAAKYLAILILSLVTALCVCAGLSACSNGDDDMYRVGGDWDEYEGVKVAFADEAAYNNGEIDESEVFPELNCLLNERQYMIIDFDIQADRDNSGRETVTANLKIQPASLVAATIQDTNTGNISEETKDGVTELKATYKIPEKADSVRNMRLVIQFQANGSGLASLDLTFENSGIIQGVKTEKIEKSAVMGYTEELTYERGAWAFEVSGISDKTKENVIVPTMNNGRYVTGIGYEAFLGCSYLKSITLPNSVESIDGYAFKDCSGLERIEVDANNEKYKSENSCILSKDGKTLILGCKTSIIRDSVTSIGSYAFYGRSGGVIQTENSVQYVDKWVVGYDGETISDTVTLRRDAIGIGDYVFADCSELISVTISDSVTSIGWGAFYGCSRLTSITMPFVGATLNGTSYEHFGYIFGANEYRYNAEYVPESLKTVIVTKATIIGNSAFGGCSGLTSITIPNCVTNMGDSAFRGCSGLTSVIIPDSVTWIRDRAFAGCSGLTSITIPDSVTSIGVNAFLECSGLTSITIPVSVTWIGNSFNCCSRLTSITFKGTKEQWKAIGKHTSWNYKTGNYTVHCIDGDLTKEEAG